MRRAGVLLWVLRYKASQTKFLGVSLRNLGFIETLRVVLRLELGFKKDGMESGLMECIA